MIKRPTIETKINHERWLVSYSDFITLLFAFFVVMYSISQVNEKKYEELSKTLSETFNSTKSLSNSSQVDLDGSSSNDSDSINSVSGALKFERSEVEKKSNLADLNAVSKEISAALSGAIQDGRITVEGNEQWIEIDVNANLLFESGSAALSGEAVRIFEEVASILSPFDNVIEVSGHTDNIPINNTDFDSNWALSSARAVSVVTLLSQSNVEPIRLSAVGFGEFRPKASNETPEGRSENRRVVLRVAQSVAPSLVMDTDDYAGSSADAGSQEGEFEKTDTVQERVESLPDEQGIHPIELEDGGLLFTNDPNSPRLQTE